jgi:SAM-dependent methyltransferase
MESPAPGDPKRRFTDRVENYVKYRPDYPKAVLGFLDAAAGLTPRSIIADIGSGTGISSNLFLENGNTVYGVEPNAAMRAAAEQRFAGVPSFRSIDGSAEATTLPAASVDLVVAGQAFHWFNPPNARAEFARILRPGGHVALLWNTRKLAGSPFLEAYESLLLEFGTDYHRVRHEQVDGPALQAFYGPAGYRAAAFPNAQSLDHAGLLGRLLSSSYAPAPGHPRHAAMLEAVDRLFARFNHAGRVEIAYETEVYVGPVPLKPEDELASPRILPARTTQESGDSQARPPA